MRQSQENWEKCEVPCVKGLGRHENDSHTRVHRPAHHWRTTEQSICLTHDCYPLDTEAQGLPVEISQYNCQFCNREDPSVTSSQGKNGQLYAHRTLLLSKTVSRDERVGSAILTLNTRKRCSLSPRKTQEQTSRTQHIGNNGYLGVVGVLNPGSVGVTSLMKLQENPPRHHHGDPTNSVNSRKEMNLSN